MTTLTRWAIRHKPSGNYIPNTEKNHSQAEPCSHSVPRLFTSRHSAQSSLSRWLEGVWKLDRYRSGIYGEEYEEDLYPEKVEGRIKDDMEVVKVSVSIEVIP